MADDRNDIREARALDEVPTRAFAFLYAVSRSDALRSELAQHGYTAAEHAEGLDLLRRVAVYRTPPTYRAGRKAAAAEVEAWHKTALPRIRAALLRRFPALCEHVIGGFRAGSSAMVVVPHVLDRLASLETGAGKKVPREQGRAALEILGRRGFTPAERSRVRELVRAATHVDPPAKVPPPPVDDLRALRDWFLEWSETAGAVIVRRDHLIRLGLVRRKSPTRRRSEPVEPAAEA